MSELNHDPLSYIRHDVRNDLSVAVGRSELEVTDIEDLLQREAVHDFRESYERFERVLEEEGSFDEELIEELEQKINQFKK